MATNTSEGTPANPANTPEGVAAKFQARKSIPTNQAQQWTMADTKKLEGVAESRSKHLAKEGERLLAQAGKDAAKRSSK